MATAASQIAPPRRSLENAASRCDMKECAIMKSPEERGKCGTVQKVIDIPLERQEQVGGI